MSVLSDELTNDPLARGYAGMTDQQAADSLNTINRRGPVDVGDIKEYLLTSGIWQKVRDAIQHGANSDAREVALGLDLTLSHYFTINMADPARYAVISTQCDALIAASFMTADDKAALLAMGENRQSRAREIGLPMVRWHHVERARA